jgi:hypothetical protein
MFAIGEQGEVVAQKKLNVDLSLVNQVKDWVMQALPDFMQETTLLVQEIRCFEPGCAPIETFIAVLEEPQRFQTKIMLPLVEVAQSDVFAALPAKSAWQSGETLMPEEILHGGTSNKAALEAGMEKDRHGLVIGCSCCIGPPDTAFEDAYDNVTVSKWHCWCTGLTCFVIFRRLAFMASAQQFQSGLCAYVQITQKPCFCQKRRPN